MRLRRLGAALVTEESRAVEGSSHLFLGRRRNVAAGMEASRVTQWLGHPGGRTRCHSTEPTTAQHRVADDIAGTVGAVNVRAHMARVSRHGEPTLGDDGSLGDDR
jgi:hypothetical protein